MAKKPPRSKGTARRRKKPLPRCKAILLCDCAIIEQGTGNVSIIGTFTHFRLQKFPGLSRPFTAFVQLTDGIGAYDIVVEIHDLEKDTILAKAEGIGINFPEKLGRINVIIPLPSLPIHHAGEYDFVIHANQEVVERQKFTAIAPPEVSDESSTPNP